MFVLERPVLILNDHTTFFDPTIHHECGNNKIALKTNLFFCCTLPHSVVLHFLLSLSPSFPLSPFFSFTFPLQPHKITFHFVSVFPHPQTVYMFVCQAVSPHTSLLHPSSFLLFYLFLPCSFFSVSRSLFFLWLYHAPASSLSHYLFLSSLHFHSMRYFFLSVFFLPELFFFSVFIFFNFNFTSVQQYSRLFA